MQHEHSAFKRHAMHIRLAQTVDEVRVAQRLRYHVFHDEGGARLSGQSGLDADRFDDISEHLLVIEAVVSPGDDFALRDGNLVGTYRLITQPCAEKAGGFYSASEFDLAPLLARKQDLRFLELGRSCVLKRARGSAVVELLWQGIWNYVRERRIDVMLGCASFEGTDLEVHKAALSFLAQQVLTPPGWYVAALPQHRQEMNRVPAGSYDARRVLSRLPPLIKGYLRLGCYFGDGCVVDTEFNTVDVLVILPVSAINPRYFNRFGPPAS